MTVSNDGITDTPATTGTVSLVKAIPVNQGRINSFGYLSPKPELHGLWLTTNGGQAISGSIELQPGTYIVTERRADGWNLTGINCIGDEDDGSVVDLLEHSVEIDLDGGETIACVFVSEQVPVVASERKPCDPNSPTSDASEVQAPAAGLRGTFANP